MLGAKALPGATPGTSRTARPGPRCRLRRFTGEEGADRRRKWSPPGGDGVQTPPNPAESPDPAVRTIPEAQLFPVSGFRPQVRMPPPPRQQQHLCFVSGC